MLEIGYAETEDQRIQDKILEVLSNIEINERDFEIKVLGRDWSQWNQKI